MTNAMKLAMMRSNMNNGGEMRSGGDMEMRNDMRGGMRGEMRGGMQDDMRGGYGSNEMRGEMENAFRDRRGRRHYDNGRFAPRGEMDAEMEMESGYYEPPRMAREFEGREVLGFRGGNMVEFPKGDEMQHRQSEMQMGKGGMKSKKLDKQTVEKWLQQMQNADGSRGAHWTMEQVHKLMSQKGIEQDPVMFWAALNMMYSDYCEIAQKYGLNHDGYYIDLAEAFLDDEDVKGDKLSKYYFGVVKAQ